MPQDPSTAAEFDPTRDEFSIENGEDGLLQVSRGEGAAHIESCRVFVVVNGQHEWAGSREQAIEAALALLRAASATMPSTRPLPPEPDYAALGRRMEMISTACAAKQARRAQKVAQ